ncbi:hypothetical protein TrCOL_g5522 [Triparma columacea]|uniref:Uncharacterized protein n=1 Tax=Triparma columacea TaxID=722753 RepID=A0A9W7L4X6_9STRA|nr:hypothetical protein TrCOL_g5522 [Triparma columacea]
MKLLNFFTVISISTAFTPTPLISQSSTIPPSSSTSALFDAPEPKILISAPELPRQEDGKVHVPVIPAFAGFLAVAAAGIAKTRENRMNNQVKREENSAELLEAVKAYNNRNK